MAVELVAECPPPTALDRHADPRPGRLVFGSLAQLFELYEGSFLQGHEYRHTLTSSCGLRVTAFDRCFLHLVKLTRHGHPEAVPFDIQEEKPRIRSQLNGLGPYHIHENRARNLPSVLDALLDPHYVYELADPQTAHLGFLKHYGDKPYPFTLVLVGESKTDQCLIPVTGFPANRNRARKLFERAGRVLWSRGDAMLNDA